jgi:hypothetical protein
LLGKCNFAAEIELIRQSPEIQLNFWAFRTQMKAVKMDVQLLVNRLLLVMKL